MPVGPRPQVLRKCLRPLRVQRGSYFQTIGLPLRRVQPLECLDLQFLDSWLIASLLGQFLHKVISLPSLSSQLPPPRVGERWVDGFAARHRERPGALWFTGSLPPVLPDTCPSLPLRLPDPNLSLPPSSLLPPLFLFLEGVLPGLETGRQLLRKADALKGWPVFCCLVGMRASDNPEAGP